MFSHWPSKWPETAMDIFVAFFQENYNTPPEHTPGNPRQLWKESRLRGVFQRCVETTLVQEATIGVSGDDIPGLLK